MSWVWVTCQQNGHINQIKVAESTESTGYSELNKGREILDERCNENCSPIGKAMFPPYITNVLIQFPEICDG